MRIEPRTHRSVRGWGIPIWPIDLALLHSERHAFSQWSQSSALTVLRCNASAQPAYLRAYEGWTWRMAVLSQPSSENPTRTSAPIRVTAFGLEHAKPLASFYFHHSQQHFGLLPLHHDVVRTSFHSNEPV